MHKHYFTNRGVVIKRRPDAPKKWKPLHEECKVKSLLEFSRLLRFLLKLFSEPFFFKLWSAEKEIYTKDIGRRSAGESWNYTLTLQMFSTNILRFMYRVFPLKVLRGILYTGRFHPGDRLIHPPNSLMGGYVPGDIGNNIWNIIIGYHHSWN